LVDSIASLVACVSENYETQVWLDVALSCEHISEEHHRSYTEASERVGRLLSFMQKNANRFLLPKEQRLK